MRKCFLSVAVIVCSVRLSVAAQANLIKNPGFESGSKIATSSGNEWWLSQGIGTTEAKIDHEVAHTGKSSLRMQSADASKCVVVSPQFEVALGDELHFEVWVKAESGGSNVVVQAGLAFRRKEGNVTDRAYFHSKPLNDQWTLISGIAHAPAEAATCEIHLGYSNSPAVIWFDDAAAVITTPISFWLKDWAKPWVGDQIITLRVANRQPTAFNGSVSCTIGKAVTSEPVALEPGTARDFKLPIKLESVGQHEFKIVLHDATSPTAPTRAMQGKFHVAPPLQLFPACPCYQIAGMDVGDTRIDAHLNINPVQLSGLKLIVEVSDEPSNTVLRQASNPHGEYAGVSIRVPNEKPGVFAVTAILVDSMGRKLATEKTDIHISAEDNASVAIGPDGFLRIGGKAQFPIGLYNSGHDEELAKAGFTATHNYGITTGEADDPINPNEAELKEMLDKSWANGMRMMVELPRKAIEKAKWEQVRRRIETFKHHPGLLCWGSEERVARGLAPLANITKLYSIVHELDPGHPLVLGDSRDVIEKFKVDRRDFFSDESMDIGIWWWYPFPLTAGDANGLEGAGENAGLLEPPAWLVTTHSQKPLWIAIQAYQRPAKDSIFPTPEQYRCQSYMSIIDGVKGLWFYVGFGQKDYLGKPAGLLNKPEESHWSYVQKLVGELHDFTPVIVSPKSEAEIAMTPANAPVEFTTRRFAGDTYLIAANKSPKEQKVTFSGKVFKDAKVKVLFEQHPAAIDGDSLADEFGALGVHVYDLESK